VEPSGRRLEDMNAPDPVAQSIHHPAE